MGSSPRRAAFVGYQGFGNLGDEAILAGIEQVLGPLPVRAEVIIGGPAVDEVVAFPEARRVQPARLLPTPAALRALRRCEVVILSGGGLFNDHWATVIPRYLAWIAAGRLMGARVIWLGVGVGPIRRRAWRWLARLAARLSHVVLVRDAQSARLLGGGPRIRIVPDMAFFSRRPEPKERSRVLALIVRPPVRDRPDAGARLRGVLVELAAAGAAGGLEPRLELMAPSADGPFAAEVADAIAARIGRRPRIEPLGATPGEALERIAGWEAVASVRLHGLILASLAGVPCLPIAYDPKVISIADQLGVGDAVIDPDGDPHDVATLLDRVRPPARVAEVEQRVTALRSRLEDVRGWIAEAL